MTDRRPLRERQQELFAARIAEHDREVPGWARAWENFRALLLTYGGTEVCPPMTASLEDFLHVAQLQAWASPTVVMIEGEPSSCHSNVAALWDRQEIDAIGSGYAVLGDGLWRQHTWGFRGDTVVETTVHRDIYAGIRLTGGEAAWFAMANRRL